MSNPKQPTAPAQLGQLDYLRSEVQRLAAQLGPPQGSLSAQYAALDNQRSELERVSSDLSLPFDQASSDRENRIAALCRRLKAIEPLMLAEQAAQAVQKLARAEYQAAADDLNVYEYTAARLRDQLDSFDLATRRWEALRDFDRSTLAAELARLVGGSAVALPYPQLDKLI